MSFFYYLRLDLAAKIRWKMAFVRDSSVVPYVDKFKVKKIAQNLGLNVSNTLRYFQSVSDINFDNLPDSYFIKATHASGWNILCYNNKYYYFKDGSGIWNSKGELCIDRLSSIELNCEEVESMCAKWLRSIYNKKEWVYHDVTPGIVVEEILSSKLTPHLFDYRFYVYKGKCHYISMGSPYMRSHMLNILYDRSWEVIYTEGDLSLLNKTLPGKPKVLNSMISAAESLGKTFDFTRVDLYLIDNKAFLGEVTFTPHRGGYATPMKDLTSNLLLSNPWRMYNLELIQAYWLHIKKLKKHIRAYKKKFL